MTGDDLENNSISDSKPVIEFKKRGNLTKPVQRKREYDIDEEEDINRAFKMKTDRANQKQTETEYVIGSRATAVFESTREAVQFKYGGDATSYNEIDTSIDRDARAIAERNSRLKAQAENEQSSDKLYHGLGAYTNYTGHDNTRTNASGTVAPSRAPSFLRSINRFDYQPDICKDYKETGFCGFGDSCKFLHDRGDYKSGWQLEREWDLIQQKKKKKLEEASQLLIKQSIASDIDVGFSDVDGLSGNTGDDEDEENYAILEDTALPFACFICREDFKYPVVSTCGHYFCRDCAINANKTDPACKACGKKTFGVFNRALKLEKKLAAVAAATGKDKSDNVSEGIKISLIAKNQGSWESVE